MRNSSAFASSHCFEIAAIAIRRQRSQHTITLLLLTLKKIRPGEIIAGPFRFRIQQASGGRTTASFLELFSGRLLRNHFFVFSA
jgi:hypothetical protein